MLRLKTFGTPVLRRDDGPVGLGAAQRRRFALLALLAAAGDEGMSRDKLIAYLWPEAGEEHARHTLAQTLYLLRRDLPGADIVLGTSDLRLNPGAIESDIAALTAALAAGDLDRAAALYAGPFLDGFYLAEALEFERWADTARARFAARARAAFERAARDAAARSDLHRAVEWWRRVALIDPLDARVAVQIMESLAAIGDRSGALHHARMHEELVREDLDAPPDPAVTALAARLRAADRTAPHLPSDPPAAPAPLGPRLHSIGPSPELPPRTERSADQSAAGDSPPLRRPMHWPARARLAGISGVAALLLLAALGARAVFRWYPAGSSVSPIFAIGPVRDYSDGDSSALARPIGDMLATNLARVPHLRVVSNARIYELLGAAHPDADGDLSARIGAAARQAGATEIVEGTMYRRRAGLLRFDVRRVDIGTGAIREAYSVEGADAFELVDRATSELAADLGATMRDTLHVADVTTRSLAAYRLYEDGLRAYYQHGDAQGARQLFLDALGEDSSFAMAEFYAAETERALGMAALDRFVHAARLANRASERERLLARGTAALYSGEPAVLAIAETLTARYPTEPDGQYLLGQALTSGGDFLGAVPHLRRAVEMDAPSLRGTTPRCRACDALLGMTMAYWLADSLAAAEREARTWTRAQPGLALPWRSLSGVLLLQGRFGEARVAAHRADRLPPGGTDPLLEPMIALRSGDFATADSALRRWLRDEPRSEAAWFLSLSLRYQGRLNQALTIAQQADGGASGAGRPPAQGVAEAIVLFDMGRHREAAAIFATMASRPAFRPEYRGRNARNSAWNLTHEATARAAAGDTAALAPLADSIQRLGVSSAYGRDQRLHHYVRGLLLRARGQPEAAAEELRRGLFSLTDGYTRNSYELARTLLALDRPAEAIRVLQPAFRGSLQASNSYVTLTELHELLAQAFDAAAQPDSAAAHYRYVVRAWERADAPFRGRWERARERLASFDREPRSR